MTDEGVPVVAGAAAVDCEPLWWPLTDDERRLLARWLAGRYLSATYDGAWDRARVLLGEFEDVWPAPRAGDGRGRHDPGCGGHAGGCVTCASAMEAIEELGRS